MAVEESDDVALPRWGWLGCALPAGAAWISVAVAALLGGRSGGLVGALVAGATTAILTLPSASIGDAIIPLATCAVAASVGRAPFALDLDDFSRPFFAQESGQRALLLLRAGVLILALVRIGARGRRQTAALAAIAVVVAVSLVWRGLLLPGVLVAAGLSRRFAHRGSERVRARNWLAALVVLVPCLALVPVPSRSSPAVAPSGSLADAVAFWRGRGNPYRARGVALEHAKAEPLPGEAYLALASIDHELGQVEKARKVLAKTLEHPASDAIRERAVKMQETWDDERRP
jgi:hypothetical protein